MFPNKKWMTLMALAAMTALILSACAAPTPVVVEKEVPVVKEVIKTVVVEKEVPVEKEVVKTVEVIKEVEKPVVVEKEVEVLVTPTPAPVERTGAWLDTVVFVEEPNSEAAVTRLEVGDIDVFAYNISEPDIAARIFDLANAGVLAYETAYGNYNELTFAPSAGPEFAETGAV